MTTACGGKYVVGMLDMPVTAQHEAYRHLRDRILDAALPADALINPAEIAEQLGISRMPARGGDAAFTCTYGFAPQARYLLSWR